MKRMFDEYADFIFTAFISIIIISLFVLEVLTNIVGISLDVTSESLKPLNMGNDISPVTIASFEGKDILVQVNEKFNHLDRISAFNSNDEDIKDYVSIVGFDSSEKGEKEIRYILNYNGETRAIKAKLIVVDEKEEEST